MFPTNSSQLVHANSRGALRALDIDPQTYCLVVLENEHHHIHEGLAWIVNGVATLNNGQVRDFTVTTPNTDWLIHLRAACSATNQGYMALYADPTISVAGQAYVPTIANQDEINVPMSTWTSSPTITNVGTQLLYLIFGDGTTAGGTDAQNEIVLKRNTTYLLRFASSVASTIVNWNTLFYEHSRYEEHE